MSEKLAQQAQAIRRETPSVPVGNPAQHVNLIAYYQKQYPFLAQSLGDPQKLMAIIDSSAKGNAGRSPGTAYDGFTAEKAQAALKDIWGINAYTPRGFQSWSDTDKRWFDPRKESGGVDTEAMQ